MAAPSATRESRVRLAVIAVLVAIALLVTAGFLGDRYHHRREPRVSCQTHHDCIGPSAACVFESSQNRAGYCTHVCEKNDDCGLGFGCYGGSMDTMDPNGRAWDEPAATAIHEVKLCMPGRVYDTFN